MTRSGNSRIALSARTLALALAGVTCLTAATVVTGTAAPKPPPPTYSVATSVNGTVGASATVSTAITAGLTLTNTSSPDTALASFKITVPKGPTKLGAPAIQGGLASGWTARFEECERPAATCQKVIVVAARTRANQLRSGQSVSVAFGLTTPATPQTLTFPVADPNPSGFRLSGPPATIVVGGAVVVPPAFTVTSPTSATAGTATQISVASTPAFTGTTVNITLGTSDCAARVSGIAPANVAGVCTSVSGVAVTPVAGAFSVPATFTKAGAQSVTVAAPGATSGSKSFSVAAGTPIVTVDSVTDTSATPANPKLVQGGTFAVAFHSADAYGNPIAAAAATLSSPNASGAFTPATPGTTTDATGYGTITASYSAVQLGLQLQVTITGQSGSATADVVAAGAITVSASPNVATGPLQIPAGSGTATADLPNGAFGPVSLYEAPVDCAQLPANSGCAADWRGVTLDFVSTQGATHLYSNLNPAKLTITCPLVDCPVPMAASPTAGQLASGWSHTCAVRPDATLQCWGDNSLGQLGDGAAEPFSSWALTVPGLTGVTRVSAGVNDTCALTVDAAVYCWGQHYGSTPTAVAGLPAATDISVSGVHACAITAATELWCWGRNGSGQLGTGPGSVDAVDHAPAPVMLGGDITLDGVTHVAAFAAYADPNVAGSGSTCALATGPQQLFCWGDNSVGQLGINNGDGVAAPYPAFNAGTTPLDTLSGLAAGGSSICAPVVASNSMYCWGANQSGQLAQNTDGASVMAPSWAAIPSDFAITSIAMGAFGHACATSSQGDLFCWGANGSGQIGQDPAVTTSTNAPTYVTTSTATDPASLVSAGDAVSCMMQSDWTVQCMGYNADGELGNGGVVDSWSLTAVLGLTMPVHPLVAEYQAHPIYLSLKVNNVYQPFALAPMCVGVGGDITTGFLASGEATAAGFCIDEFAITRDPVTGDVSYPILFVEDPTATPLSKKA